jgi:hypothetical protein
MWIWHLIDLFFLLFHGALTLFNLFGWLIRSLRKLNLITLLLTGASWFILGIFFGIGYCPLTDLHWKVLGKLGAQALPDSYISYLLLRITGIQFKDSLIELGTAILFFVALSLSIFLNARDYLLRNKQLQER